MNLRGRVGRRLNLARANKVVRLIAAQYASVTSELHYHGSEVFFQEFLDLKGFFRRAFQALAYNTIEGDYAEFGCFGARTFTLAWGASRLVGHSAHLWAFDSFQGLPQSTDVRDIHAGWLPGAMAMSERQFIDTCLGNGLDREAFTTVVGFYSDSLSPVATGRRPDKVCFAYIDCDLYSSTIEALRFLGDRLCHGAIIAFDDYFCFSTSHPSGERLAAAEYFGDHPKWRLVPYIQWGWYGMSFMVEDRATGPIREQSS